MNIILIHFGQSQAYVLLPLCSRRVLAALLKSSCQHMTTQGNHLILGSACSFARDCRELCLSYSFSLLCRLLSSPSLTFFSSWTVIVYLTSLSTIWFHTSDYTSWSLLDLSHFCYMLLNTRYWLTRTVMRVHWDIYGRNRNPFLIYRIRDVSSLHGLPNELSLVSQFLPITARENGTGLPSDAARSSQWWRDAAFRMMTLIGFESNLLIACWRPPSWQTLWTEERQIPPRICTWPDQFLSYAYSQLSSPMWACILYCVFPGARQAYTLHLAVK